MGIAVTCQQCRRTFQVKEKYAGRQGTCPSCKASVCVPALAPAANDDDWRKQVFELDEVDLATGPGASSPSVSTIASSSAIQSSDQDHAAWVNDRFEFPCENCGHALRAEARHVGRKIRCGACDHKFRIPADIAPRREPLDVATPPAPSKPPQGSSHISRDATPPPASPRAASPSLPASPSPPTPSASTGPPQSPRPLRPASQTPASQNPAPQSRALHSDNFSTPPPAAPVHSANPYRPPLADFDQVDEPTRLDFDSSSIESAEPSEPWDRFSTPADETDGVDLGTTTVARDYVVAKDDRNANSSPPRKRHKSFSARLTTIAVLLTLLTAVLRIGARLDLDKRLDVGAPNVDMAELWKRREEFVAGLPSFQIIDGAYMPGADPSKRTQHRLFVMVGKPSNPPTGSLFVTIKSPLITISKPIENTGVNQGGVLELRLEGGPVDDPGPFEVFLESQEEGFWAALTTKKKVSSNVLELRKENQLPEFARLAGFSETRSTGFAIAPGGEDAKSLVPPNLDNPIGSAPANPAPFVPSPSPARNSLSPAEQHFLPASERITRSLADLLSADRATYRAAAETLELLAPDERQPEVAAALEPLLSDADDEVRFAAADALAIWATPANLDALLSAIDRAQPREIRSLLAALAKTNDKRAANAIAARMLHNTGDATRTLQSMGPIAEAPAIRFLKSPDLHVRRGACDVLKAVGAQNCLDDLKKLDRDPLVRDSAAAAYYAVQARIKAAKAMDERQAEEKTPPALKPRPKRADPDNPTRNSESGLPRGLKPVE